ncbi:hypothetical protein RI054_11g58190 [Pseudoscourfieldia marina]
MDTLASLLLGVGHGFFGYTHLADPVAAVAQILPELGEAAATDITKHCIGVIGSVHAFVSLVFVMLALSGGAHTGLRKCILGCYLVSFIPLAIYVVYTFPPSGKAPEKPTDMPMPLLGGFGAVALIGMVLGASSAKKVKTKTK